MTDSGLQPTLRFSWTVSLQFRFIERFESLRLIYATYPAKMRRYKVLARIFLMLSVIDLALTAPVVVQEHECALA